MVKMEMFRTYYRARSESLGVDITTTIPTYRLSNGTHWLRVVRCVRFIRDLTVYLEKKKKKRTL